MALKRMGIVDNYEVNIAIFIIMFRLSLVLLNIRLTNGGRDWIEPSGKLIKIKKVLASALRFVMKREQKFNIFNALEKALRSPPIMD